jgi:hypothetical protein
MLVPMLWGSLPTGPLTAIAAGGTSTPAALARRAFSAGQSTPESTKIGPSDSEKKQNERTIKDRI